MNKRRTDKNKEEIKKNSENSKRIIEKIPYKLTEKSHSGTFRVIIEIVQTCLLPYAVFSWDFHRVLTC